MSLGIVLFVKSTLVVAFGWALCFGARRSNAATRHWIWTATFGALAILLLFHTMSPRWLFEIPASSSLARVIPDLPVEIEEKQVASPAVLAVAVDDDVGAWLYRAWWLGTLLLWTRVLFDLAALTWARRRGRRLRQPERLRRSFERRAGARADVLLSPHVRVPMAFGFFRPTVLLPATAATWTEKRIEFVVLHELTHVRRRDPVTTLASQLVAAVYWPNPLVWLAASSFHLEREKACDEAVLHAGADRVAYAEELVEIARAFTALGPRSSAPMASGGGLANRIGGILAFRPSARRSMRLVTGLCLMVVTLLIVPLSVVALRVQESSGASQWPTSFLARPSDRGDVERKWAVWALGEREDASAVASLIETLGDPDPEMRSLSAWSLGEIKDRSAVEPLVALLHDEDAFTREMAARALGEIEDRRALPALEAALGDSESAVRAAAIWALGEIDSRRAVSLARSRTQDSGRDVRREAARQIARERNSTSVDALTRLLSDSDPRVREEAARGLGLVGSEDGVDALIAVLRDDDHAVRDAATWALDEINPSRGGK